MFGVFLLLALILVLYSKGIKNKYSLVFILTIITTLSTTSLIAMLVALGFYFFRLNTSIVKILTITLFPFLIVQVVALPFVGDKINNEIDNKDTAYSRFGAFLLHVDQIKDQPLLGYGVNINDDQLKRLGSCLLYTSPSPRD